MNPNKINYLILLKIADETLYYIVFNSNSSLYAYLLNQVGDNDQSCAVEYHTLTSKIRSEIMIIVMQ